MSLHSDLLKQAHQLARKEPRKPTQASLRRSVSASYYALFHLLVDEATRLMLSGNDRGPLRDCLARAFEHSSMKNVAVAFSEKRFGKKLSFVGFNEQNIPEQLIKVAAVFVQLQEARHDADYNRAYRFDRNEALDLFEQTELAFENWKAVKGDLYADMFLTGLLAYRQMKG